MYRKGLHQHFLNKYINITLGAVNKYSKTKKICDEMNLLNANNIGEP